MNHSTSTGADYCRHQPRTRIFQLNSFRSFLARSEAKTMCLPEGVQTGNASCHGPSVSRPRLAPLLFIKQILSFGEIYAILSPSGDQAGLRPFLSGGGILAVVLGNPDCGRDGWQSTEWPRGMANFGGVSRYGWLGIQKNSDIPGEVESSVCPHCLSGFHAPDEPLSIKPVRRVVNKLAIRRHRRIASETVTLSWDVPTLAFVTCKLGAFTFAKRVGWGGMSWVSRA